MSSNKIWSGNKTVGEEKISFEETSLFIILAHIANTLVDISKTLEELNRGKINE